MINMQSVKLKLLGPYGKGNCPFRLLTNTLYLSNVNVLTSIHCIWRHSIGNVPEFKSFLERSKQLLSDGLLLRQAPLTSDWIGGHTIIRVCLHVDRDIVTIYPLVLRQKHLLYILRYSFAESSHDSRKTFIYGIII